MHSTTIIPCPVYLVFTSVNTTTQRMSSSRFDIWSSKGRSVSSLVQYIGVGIIRRKGTRVWVNVSCLVRSSIKSGVVQIDVSYHNRICCKSLCVLFPALSFCARRSVDDNNSFSWLGATNMDNPIMTTMSDNNSATKVDSSSLAEILSLVNSATSAATKKRLAARSWELYMRQLGDCSDDDFVAPPRELLLYLVR